MRTTDSKETQSRPLLELLVGEDELQADLGIKLGEFVQALGQPSCAEADRGRNSQHAGRPILGLLQPCLDGFELHQHVVRRAVEELALFGEDQAAGMAVKQRHRQFLLERADLARHRRLRQAELLTRMGEASRLGGGVEDF